MQGNREEGWLRRERKSWLFLGPPGRWTEGELQNNNTRCRSWEEIKYSLGIR
jgi:hypothetical protein